LDKILTLANQSEHSLWTIVQNPAAAGIGGAARAAIEQFVVMMQYMQSMLASRNAYEIAFEIGKRSQLVAEFYNDKSVEGQARYENVQALLNSIKEYTETPNED